MFNSRLNTIIELLSLFPSTIEEETGISKNLLWRWRNGKSNPLKPVNPKLKIFCEKYRVNYKWLAFGEGDPFMRKVVALDDETKKILKMVALIKLEHRTTQKAIQSRLGLSATYFTDLKKGTFKMPVSKVQELERVYRVRVL